MIQGKSRLQVHELRRFGMIFCTQIFEQEKNGNEKKTSCSSWIIHSSWPQKTQTKSLMNIWKICNLTTKQQSDSCHD